MKQSVADYRVSAAMQRRSGLGWKRSGRRSPPRHGTGNLRRDGECGPMPAMAGELNCGRCGPPGAGRGTRPRCATGWAGRMGDEGGVGGAPSRWISHSRRARMVAARRGRRRGGLAGRAPSPPSSPRGTQRPAACNRTACRIERARPLRIGAFRGVNELGKGDVAATKVEGGSRADRSGPVDDLPTIRRHDHVAGVKVGMAQPVLRQGGCVWRQGLLGRCWSGAGPGSSGPSWRGAGGDGALRCWGISAYTFTCMCANRMTAVGASAHWSGHRQTRLVPLEICLTAHGERRKSPSDPHAGRAQPRSTMLGIGNSGAFVLHSSLPRELCRCGGVYRGRLRSPGRALGPLPGLPD